VPQQFATAKDVSEHLLQRSGDALMTGDFDTFLTCFLLPQKLGTFDGLREVATQEDVREVFDNVRAHFHANHVTDMVRQCVDARFRTPDEVAATHVSRLLSGTTLLYEPYPVFSILKRRHGVWQVAHSEYAMSENDQHAKVLKGK